MKGMHISDNLALLLSTVTLFSGVALASSHVSAEDPSVVDQINITVPVACTMSGTGQTSHNATLNPGTYSGASGSEYEAGIGKTTLTTYCNDNNGFSIYAIGFTGDLYKGESHTKLIGQNTNQSISTKVYTNGDTDSNWSMKVTKVDNPVSGDPITYNPDNMSIQNSFNSWHEVPDTYTKVAQYNSSTTDPATTDTTLGAKLETTYATYISSSQPADTYTGQVKYTLVHPYDRYAPEAPYFQVFYTGRPASTEPGHENPVKIRMSDLPADGKYNLLGTADGLYDKLTPDTYYGGYYKNIVDSPENFIYTNETEYYDGTNFNWLVSTPETADAASITPENETTYYVKEISSDRYLRNVAANTNGGGKILALWFFTDTDDINYNRVGFDVVADDVDITLFTNSCVDSFAITATGSGKTTTYTSASVFKTTGENNLLCPWRDTDNVLLNDDTEEISLVGFWLTNDGYKITGPRKRTITPNGWQTSTFSSSAENIPITITKWQESNP
jgi:hypothetical protein